MGVGRNVKMLAMVTCLFVAQANAEEGQFLSRFSSWAIIKSGDIISLSSSTENLGIACGDSTLTYMTLVRVSDPSAVIWNPTTKAFHFHFTAWADASAPSDYSLLVRNQNDRMATGIVILNPKYTDQHNRFWTMLKSARSKISYSTPHGRTVSTDATDLAPAISRFQQECGKLFLANAHGRLQEPIPREWLNR